MKKETQEHLMGAIKDVIALGTRPDHVAAFLVGQVVYMFKESGYSDDQVIDLVSNILQQY